MDVSVSYYSSEGGRTINEDAVYICEHENKLLAMVADGLGGLAHGDRAAKIAVRTISAATSMEALSSQLLDWAVERANSDIICEQNGEQMCSTISILWMDSFKAFVSHVGDSRIYQFRRDGIIYQSIDHSVSQMAVIMGEITPSEIRGHKDRNRLVRALGASQTVKPETDALNIRDGDAFLLCSDGFWELIEEQNMIEYLSQSRDAGEWLDKMKRHVDKRQTDDSDNNSAVTVIVRNTM